jgi:hypothetical protein
MRISCCCWPCCDSAWSSAFRAPTSACHGSSTTSQRSIGSTPAALHTLRNTQATTIVMSTVAVKGDVFITAEDNGLDFDVDVSPYGAQV